MIESAGKEKIQLEDYILPNTKITIRTNNNECHKYTLSGIEVLFPYEAYPLQLDYMTKVIEAAQESKNALLESPTGTGKTLCLLCASLAWLKHQKEKEAMKPSKIIYATRTHSQIAQIIKELKKTPYEPYTITLGSREMMCINKEICNHDHERAQVDFECKNLIRRNLCQYYQQKQKAKDFVGKDLCDIEELNANARGKVFCPFFYSRENMNDCDLLLMPYNYVIDPKIRETLEVDLRNSVLIIDEAHNICKVCEDATSVEFYIDELMECQKELDEVGKMKDKPERYPSISEDLGIISAKSIDQARGPINAFHTYLKSIQIPDPKGIRQFGNHVFEYFMKATKPLTAPLSDDQNDVITAGITLKNCGLYLQNTFSIAKVLTFFKGSCRLNNWARAVETVFLNAKEDAANSEKTKMNLNSFGILIIDENQTEGGYRHKGKKDEALQPPKRKFALWCFNAGFQFNSILNCMAPPRCSILTSGTLSPLNALATELNSEFKVRLENHHVISNDQVFASILCKGDNQCPLNFKYNNRDNDSMKEAVTSTLLLIAQSVHGGILVFFPSYALLNMFSKLWEGSLQRQLTKINTIIYKENKDNEENDKILLDYRRSIKMHGGAILLAVCRGKVSEGLDFSDDAARVVINIGIPYPNYVDPHVEMKRLYLDKNTKISGMDWYTMEAIRAINQSMGRVIRHKNDFGAIILIDERLTSSSCKDLLSKWVRDRIIIYNNPTDMHNKMIGFFTKCNSNVNLKAEPIKVKPNQETIISLPKELPHQPVKAPIIAENIMHKLDSYKSDSSKMTLENLANKPKVSAKPGTNAKIDDYFKPKETAKRKYGDFNPAAEAISSKKMQVFGLPSATVSMMMNEKDKEKNDIAVGFLNKLKKLLTKEEFEQSGKFMTQFNSICKSADELFTNMKNLICPPSKTNMLEDRKELLMSSINFICKNYREQYTKLVKEYVDSII